MKKKSAKKSGKKPAKQVAKKKAAKKKTAKKAAKKKTAKKVAKSAKKAAKKAAKKRKFRLTVGKDYQPSKRRPRRRASKKRRKSSPGWGGPRPGAGSKPVGAVPGVAHRSRPLVDPNLPVHVVLAFRKRLPDLRTPEAMDTIRECLSEMREDPRVRIVHFSLMRDHLHAIVEATDGAALSKGMASLSIMLARRLNRVWHRKGSVFAERFHSEVLSSPEDVRNALRVVLLAGRKRGFPMRRGLDPYSSADCFDGWKEKHDWERAFAKQESVERPRSELLRQGWRKADGGLLSKSEVLDKLPKILRQG